MANSMRMVDISQKVLELHAAVRRWTEHIPVNLPYVDLLFAFNLAKMGEASKARLLIEDARKVMEVSAPTTWLNTKQTEEAVYAITSNFLFKVFTYRIDLILSGKPHASPLSPELMADLDAIWHKEKTAGTNNPYVKASYVIARYRYDSWVVEPNGKMNPYLVVTSTTGNSQHEEFRTLYATRDPEQLKDHIRRLLRHGLPDRKPEDLRLHLVHGTLPLASLVGEVFAVELLQEVPIALTTQETPKSLDMTLMQGETLERSFSLASHFGRSDIIKTILDCFSRLIKEKPDNVKLKLIDIVAGECLRSLKKLGMREEIDCLLHIIRSEALHGDELPELTKRYSADPKTWAATLRTLLNLASCRLALGSEEQACYLLDEALNQLLKNPQSRRPDSSDFTGVARAYVTACGYCNSDMGLIRLLEFFQKMNPKSTNNTFSSANCFSRFHLQVIEDAIRALAGDE